MFISVVVPAYNEEKRIKKTLVLTSDYLVRHNFKYEIIVVDDASFDDTAEVVESLKNQIKNLILIKNGKNKGKGAVVRQGLALASGEYKLFIDADYSTSIEELDKFLPFLDDYDIIIASRGILGSEILIPQPFYRRFLGGFYNFLVKILTPIGEFQDTQCGFKLFKAKTIDDILPKCKINGWSFDVEILIAAKKMGYKIKEVPVAWKNDKDTKVKLKGMINSIFDLIRIGWTGQFLKFSVVGLFGTLINFIILYSLTDIFRIYYIYSAFFAFLVAMTVNFIFNKLWTFDDKDLGFAKKYIRFSLVSLVALAVNLFFLYFFTNKLHIYYLVSQIFAIVPSIFINFIGNKFWTFKTLQKSDF